MELVVTGHVYDATLTTTTRGDVRVTQGMLGNAIVLIGEEDPVYDEEFPDIPDEDIVTISMYPCEGRSIPPVDFKYTYKPLPKNIGGVIDFSDVM